jgi:tripartite ATP-independent transporter DctM subunit
MIPLIIAVFFVLAAFGMPLSFALGLASLAGMLYGGLDPIQIPGKMVHAVDSFPLMAIPLFMLAGQLMIRGGIMGPLIEFANAVVGRVRGGLAHVTVLSAMGLSSVTGVAVADATALGGTLGPALTKAYSREFGASVVASASCMGPIIPPSAAMIVYAIMVEDISVAGLFMAGVVPGVVMGVAMMALCSVIAARRGYPPTGDPFTVRNLLRQARRSLFVFTMPVVVLGGIIGGVFTATEGAAIAVVYALAIGFGVTRKLRLADLPSALLNAGILSAVVGALLAFSSTVTHIFTLELVAVWMVETFQRITAEPYAFLALVMVALLVAGMFMESNTIIVMLAPILAPIAIAYGLDPLYFGFLFVMNIVLGSITPPVGILLFVASGIWGLRLTAIIANIWPFILLLYGVLAVCLLVPELILYFPHVLGYSGLEAVRPR